MRKIIFTTVALLTLSAVSASAQVTIGSTADPQPFSILELDGRGERGLRLPQLDATHKQTLTNELTGLTDQTKKAAAPGLQIFNTTTRCVETWNGTKWIQQCPPEGPFVPHYNPTCDEDPSCTAITGFTAKALSGDKNLTYNSVSFTMKPVTGGVFYMGRSSNTTEPNYSESGDIDEGPVHKVALNSFYMSETVVTQALFETVMGGKPSWTSHGTGDNYPAYNVSWYDAIAFCNKLSLLAGRTQCYAVNGITDWLSLEYSSIPTSSGTEANKWNAATCNWSANGFRLPTEAEWEYAARGGQANEYTRTLGTSGTQYIYSGSNDICEVAWYNGNNSNNTDCVMASGIYGTKQVKGKKANELGIYDMSGNVWEWCWDWGVSTYGSCCVDNINARGPSSGTPRILRGGDRNNAAADCRVSYRSGNYPFIRNTYSGFRVVAGAI